MSTSLVRAARLILVVHAATAATRAAAFATAADEPGSADLAAAARLVLPAAATLLTAPSRAAERTAEALGRPFSTDPAVRDLDIGRWAGSPLTAIAPDVLAAWLGDPYFDGHGGESLATMASRVRTFLDARRDSPGWTIAVSHAAVVRAAVLATLDAPFSAFWRIEAPPLAMLTLSSDGRRWTLRGLEARSVTTSGG